jgi:hypothetical protein
MGSEFQIDILQYVYPVAEHLGSLSEIINEMVAMNVFGPTTDASGSNVLCFIDGFMRDVALSRLLLNQKQFLCSQINEAKMRYIRQNDASDLQVEVR